MTSDAEPRPSSSERPVVHDPAGPGGGPPPASRTTGSSRATTRTRRRRSGRARPSRRPATRAWRVPDRSTAASGRPRTVPVGTSRASATMSGDRAPATRAGPEAVGRSSAPGLDRGRRRCGAGAGPGGHELDGGPGEDREPASRRTARAQVVALDRGVVVRRGEQAGERRRGARQQRVPRVADRGDRRTPAAGRAGEDAELGAARTGRAPRPWSRGRRAAHRRRPGTGGRGRCPRSRPTVSGWPYTSGARNGPGAQRELQVEHGGDRRAHVPSAASDQPWPPQAPADPRRARRARRRGPAAASGHGWPATTPNTAAASTIPRSAERGRASIAGSRVCGSRTSRPQRTSASTSSASSARWRAWASAAAEMPQVMGVSARPTAAATRNRQRDREPAQQRDERPRSRSRRGSPTGGSSGTPARRAAPGGSTRSSPATHVRGEPGRVHRPRQRAAPSAPRRCPSAATPGSSVVR